MNNLHIYEIVSAKQLEQLDNIFLSWYISFHYRFAWLMYGRIQLYINSVMTGKANSTTGMEEIRSGMKLFLNFPFCSTWSVNWKRWVAFAANCVCIVLWPAINPLYSTDKVWRQRKEACTNFLTIYLLLYGINRGHRRSLAKTNTGITDNTARDKASKWSVL